MVQLSVIWAGVVLLFQGKSRFIEDKIDCVNGLPNKTFG